MSAKGAVMQGKKGLIMGVANDRSIAWAIAKMAADHGAELAFTYQGDALRKRVEPLATSVGSDLVMPCDVTDDAAVATTFADLAKRWSRLDFVLHAIAYSDKEQLKGQYAETTRDNFLRTMDISCYSFTAVARHAAPLMKLAAVAHVDLFRRRAGDAALQCDGRAVALEASVRYLAVDFGNENIRVNGLSAGPMKRWPPRHWRFPVHPEVEPVQPPLRRNVTMDDVGGAGLYLLSDLSGGAR